MATQLLLTGVVPAIVAAAAMWLGCWSRVRPRAAWAVSVGLGFIAGQIALPGHAGIAVALRKIGEPHVAHDWLPAVVLLATAIAALAAYTPTAWRWVPLVLAALLAFAVPLRLLAGSVYVVRHWSLGEKLLVLPLLAGALAGGWLLLATPRAGDLPRARSILLAMVATGTAVAVVLSGVLLYGQLGIVVAASLVGALLIAEWNSRPPAPPDNRDPAGAAGPIVCSLGSLILLAYFFASLTAIGALLLSLALVAAGGRLPAIPRGAPPWSPLVLRTAACLIPLTIAVALAAAGTLRNNPTGY